MFFLVLILLKFRELVNISILIIVINRLRKVIVVLVDMFCVILMFFNFVFKKVEDLNFV